MGKARRELTNITAERCVSRTLGNNIPAAVTEGIKIEMEVLVYREKSKIWDGPFQVLDV